MSRNTGVVAMAEKRTPDEIVAATVQADRQGERVATREMRFALDGKGLKVMVGRLPGTVMSYWEGDSLLRGRVTAAEVKRDRYGNLYVEVELGEAAAAG